MFEKYKWLPSVLPAEMVSIYLEATEKRYFDERGYKAVWEKYPEIDDEHVGVARRYRDGTLTAEFRNQDLENGAKLYTHPPIPIRRLKPLKPLSDEQLSHFFDGHNAINVKLPNFVRGTISDNVCCDKIPIDVPLKTIVKLVEKLHGIGE